MKSVIVPFFGGLSELVDLRFWAIFNGNPKSWI